jgi:hypothetical protein
MLAKNSPRERDEKGGNQQDPDQNRAFGAALEPVRECGVRNIPGRAHITINSSIKTNAYVL